MSGNQSALFGGSAPVGSIIQAPYNITDSSWLLCNGAKIVRSAYPSLSACLPGVGTFTSTIRTKPASLNSTAIATDGTTWVLSSVSNATMLYTTTDGITFTARTITSNAVAAVLHDGVNFVGISNTSVGPVYSSNGGASWSTSANNVAVTGPTGLCVAPSLGVSGRLCAAHAGSGYFYTSDDHGVTWAQRTHGLVGSVAYVCWTGVKYISPPTNVAGAIYTSADGVTWVRQDTSVLLASGPLVSDGAGKVLQWDATNGIANISLDHGATWTSRQFGNPFASAVNAGRFSGVAMPSFTNGRFFLSVAGANAALWSSVDLVSWALVLDAPQSVSGAAVVSYKAGVYFVNCDMTTAATMVEDTAKMYLPLGSQGAIGGSATVTGFNNFQPFIKAK